MAANATSPNRVPRVSFVDLERMQAAGVDRRLAEDRRLVARLVAGEAEALVGAKCAPAFDENAGAKARLALAPPLRAKQALDEKRSFPCKASLRSSNGPWKRGCS